jgi:hypothetical protein
VCATASAYMECGVPFAEAVQRVVHENLPKGGVRPPLLRLYVCAAGEGHFGIGQACVYLMAPQSSCGTIRVTNIMSTNY